jgi:hypothetical protein
MATQSSASGHERLLSELTVDPAENVDQLVPPVDVEAKSPSSLATTQSSASEHEMGEDGA